MRDGGKRRGVRRNRRGGKRWEEVSGRQGRGGKGKYVGKEDNDRKEEVREGGMERQLKVKRYTRKKRVV